MVKLPAAFVTLLLLIVCASGITRANDLSNDDQRFLLLREAASKEDAQRAAGLASQLTTYPLKSYVDYYPLKSRLSSANESDILDFLKRYEGSAIADRLRNDWLIVLARQNNWSRFDEQYPQFVLNDDMQVKCYALLSKFKQGSDVAGEARNLLTSGKVYGEGCYPLFTNLALSEQFSQDDVWSQIRWAAEASSTDVAIRLARLADFNEAAAALEKTGKKLTAAFNQPLVKTRQAHETALILLGRLAKQDPQQAVAALAKINSDLTTSERAIAWAQIAMPSAQKLFPEAAGYWNKVTDQVPLSLEGYQWRVRTALRNRDWPNVKAGIEAMPPSLLSEPAWVYWLGRAYQAENKSDTAQSLFKNIVDQAHFYGQLALEESGQPITIPATMPVPQSDVAALANNSGFKDALRFYAMNLRFEGNREWNWQLRKMSEHQILAAAEFARQQNVLDRMVNTSSRTKTMFDYDQRFPTPHKDVMTQHANMLGLDMAWAYGVIRQESRFVLNARSSAGASGLMQVMPATARYVAKKINMNLDIGKMNNVETNIALGTNYLNMVLQDFNGSQVLASAAYNAGPGRARAWRDSLPAETEGAIFAETIPFPETRDYVKNVLSNTIYYSALFLKAPQSLKNRLGTIAPKTAPNPFTMDNLVLKN